MSSGWSLVVGCWLGSLPARESGKPELISGADRLVCCMAGQVYKTGMGATNSVVQRACVAEASLPARKSGKPESVNSGAGGSALCKVGRVGDEAGLHTSSWCRLVIWL